MSYMVVMSFFVLMLNQLNELKLFFTLLVQIFFGFTFWFNLSSEIVECVYLTLCLMQHNLRSWSRVRILARYHHHDFQYFCTKQKKSSIYYQGQNFCYRNDTWNPKWLEPTFFLIMLLNLRGVSQNHLNYCYKNDIWNATWR